MSTNTFFNHFSNPFSRYVKNRIKEFEKLGKSGETTFNFKPFLDLELKANIKTELLFCISTANSSAISGIKFQKALENLNLEKLSEDNIEELMRKAGVRFSGKKAVYARKALDNFEYIKLAMEMEDMEARNFIVKKFKGIGYKEASHFLRNIGRKNLAIIDRHVIKWLEEKGVEIKLNETKSKAKSQTKSLTPKNYERLERVLKEFAKDISLAEFDLLIWSSITKKVLK